MDPTLRASFPKVNRPKRVAQLIWDDGLSAELPIQQRWERLPHDLEHYVVDAELGHEFAFWPLLARQFAFSSVRPLNRPWGRERLVQTRALFAAHEDDLREADAMAAPIRTLAHGDYDVAARNDILSKCWSARPPNRLSRLGETTIARIVESFRAMEARWRALPEGATLTVTWPKRSE